jgi:glycosyltransferase involved in cell wall biosynthesis
VHPGVRVPPPSGDRLPDDGPPYLLWVGALEPRKAPDVLARAFSAARADGLRAELRVVGEGRSPLDGPGIRRLGRVDDAALDALYRDALAVVTPSHGEGFGYPPLEAARHGTCAVVSDLPVFRETLGDAALRVPPGDAEALAAALLRIERDGALRRDLGARARAAVAPLSWAAAADATKAALVRATEARR